MVSQPVEQGAKEAEHPSRLFSTWRVLREYAMRILTLPIVLIALVLALAGPAWADHPRPNILWITCEDICPDLGCYGDRYARTPNLDGLARQGVRYENAFSISGVCAPSRSALITGMYPTAIGTQHMRSKGVPPAYVKCFTEYLRAAG